MRAHRNPLQPPRCSSCLEAFQSSGICRWLQIIFARVASRAALIFFLTATKLKHSSPIPDSEHAGEPMELMATGSRRGLWSCRVQERTLEKGWSVLSQQLHTIGQDCTWPSSLERWPSLLGIWSSEIDCSYTGRFHFAPMAK